MEREIFVGIDVAKETLEVAATNGVKANVLNTSEGHEELEALLTSLNPVLVVMEATGGYEYAVTEHLATRKLPVVVVNPKRVRDLQRLSAYWPRQTLLMPALLPGMPRRCGRNRDL